MLKQLPFKRGPGRTPPGLAKKPGGMPPGQYKKLGRRAVVGAPGRRSRRAQTPGTRTWYGA